MSEIAEAPIDHRDMEADRNPCSYPLFAFFMTIGHGKTNQRFISPK